MRNALRTKSTRTKALALTAAATLTLGLAACGNVGTDKKADDAAATETATTETSTADAPKNSAPQSASETPAAPTGEGIVETKGSTTVTIGPSKNPKLNEPLKVTWNSEGHSDCGTIVVLRTPDGLMLQFNPNAGCTGEFTESMDESLGSKAGTWTLMLKGTPDGDFEIPFDVS